MSSALTIVLRRSFVRLTIGLTLASNVLAVEPAELQRRLEQSPVAHPRLFLTRESEMALRERAARDPVSQQIQAGVIREADRLLSSQPVERVLIGRRLLDKSRTCLSRVLHLGLAWRLTGNAAYLQRARAELLAVAAFSDWNPSHFLDVAEMTTAVGTGYDWLHSALDEPTRRTLREAILTKGLKPSLTSESWSRVTNNWNQVCNAGMAVGALAIAEDEPALAARIVARAINTVPLAMHEYDPHGAYPEGASYWGYGTTFNVILIAALESALGRDFGLSQQPGFLATADYYLHVTGPTGFYFNYSDCGRSDSAIAPAMFWFAAKRNESYLLATEASKLARAGNGGSGRSRDRIEPLALVWMSAAQGKPSAPSALSWTGAGTTPVAMHRSSWAKDATFVAIKGGSPGTNHAHMDVGSFVMDAGGLRWADDLGMQDYHSLESKGIKLFGRTQDAERWNVFRLGISSHNVLMVDRQQQRVDGHAPIVVAKEGRTVVDTSSVYKGQLASARRGVALQFDRSVLVQDEFQSPGKKVAVRWAMLTRADVTIDGPGRATLAQAGRKLHFRVLEPASTVLKIFQTDPPPASTDARNEGTRQIGFELDLGVGERTRLVVQLALEGTPSTPIRIEPLASW
jgi:hypothetical protein